MENKAKQRVAIARDALAWVEAGALLPTVGAYVRPEHRPESSEAHKQLRDVVLGKCSVCVKGALFLAKAFRFNNVEASQWDKVGRSDSDQPLREHFEWEQLELIEAAFEGWWFRGGRTSKFVEQYPNSKDRMVAILENIIANDGTFVL